MWTEFKTFLIKDNVIGLAIAVILGVALNALVNSIVNDVIMPFINVTTAAAGGSWRDWRFSITEFRFATAPTETPEILIGSVLANLLNFFIIGFVAWRISKLFIKPKEAVQPATA